MAFAGDPVSQAIAFVGASIIAPGFEPISKMSLGIVLKRWPLIRGGGIAMLGGYATLIAAAFMGFKFLDYFHITTIDEIRALPIMETLTGASKDSLVHSICAAVAGTLVITSLRDTYVVGPLIVLVMIPSSALTGIALGAGDFALAAEAFARVAIDVGLIIGAGCLVYLWKQIAKHRREPLP
ncbi:MAG: DUF389 domain-containing protein [Proteobacteria bacterium]|nr:MAG: DUF389 domain-containing protein [Pseudomonadota bacterium]